MTFKELAIGDIFEYRDQTRQIAVKISEKEGWIFAERRKSTFAHNRAVTFPSLSGQLMTGKDGRACLMHTLDNMGRLAGFTVVPVAFVEGEQADFTVMTGNPGQRRREFDIILHRISQSRESTGKLLDALEVLLSTL